MYDKCKLHEFKIKSAKAAEEKNPQNKILPLFFDNSFTFVCYSNQL